ncbi:MAG: hypothetical protein KAS75_07275 [Planctomycetes bacterium]|nr:hypothetical protein [Planctomycetota bacterium]
MNKRWLFLIILLLAAGCQEGNVDANKLGSGVLGGVELDKQLKVNKNALLKNSSEQIRIDAASVLLFSEDERARKILVDVLTQSKNITAQAAVCKALGRARTEQKDIKNRGDFIPLLFDILNTETDGNAKLAAEATLAFEYKQISKQLDEMVSDTSKPAKARLNAIYALKLQPDMKAIFKLMELLDDSDGQVAAGSEKALRSLGIPVGKDIASRKQIIDELKRKGRNEFLRDWLIRQEAQMRNLELELDMWQRLYLSASDKIYDSIGEDEAKGKFLAEHLVDSKVILRLWSLEKVSQWRVGTKSKFPVGLGPVLVGLISDQDRDVRLKTAKLLSLMGELNSSEKLLEQLKVERDDEVKMQLFVALGGACYYAFSPNSGINLPGEIREQTFKWSVKYLFEEDAKKAQKGAEVIKKLLEQDGLVPEEVNRYLGLLAKRYKQERDNVDGSLRGELLSSMAGLCAQNIYKAESVKIFKPLFEEALADKTDLVREAAVNGLIYIDSARALDRLRKDFVNDDSVTVRKKLIELAGEVGGQDDLAWLSEKIGSNAESELVWQAMLKIFKRSEIAVLGEWMAKFDLQSDGAGLSDEQRISFLEVTERRAVSDNKLKMLKGIRGKLARLYSRTGEFEHAAEYLGVLRENARTVEEKEAFLADLLDVYLRWPNVEMLVQVVNNCLLEKDLSPNSKMKHLIDDYFDHPPAGADPNLVLEALVNKVRPPDARPMWVEYVEGWKESLDWVGDPNKP